MTEPFRVLDRAACLGLGTAQFGLDYAIDKVENRPSEEEVVRILDLAAAAGITILDTASVYGAAEKVLGRALGSRHGFRVITKTAIFGAETIHAEDAKTLATTFRRSLENMGASSIYGLMIHKAANLLSVGGEYLFDAMIVLQQQGLVDKIGVSVYEADQIERLLKRYPLELVQAPVSILDQRLIAGGQLSALKRAGVEVHVRSAFLKGLIFADPTVLPAHFQSSKPILSSFREAAKAQGISLLAAALTFLLDQPDVDTVLCGVTSAAQMKEILTSVQRESSDGRGLTRPARFALTDPAVLNPAYWPAFRI